MDKGLLVIVASGIAIVYYASNFSGNKPIDSVDAAPWSVDDKKHAYDSYYEKDVLGDLVLNLNSVQLDRAKSIWKTTPTAQHIASLLPDFDLAIAEAKNKVSDGAFKTFLMEYLENLQGNYLAGDLDEDSVQKSLLELR